MALRLKCPHCGCAMELIKEEVTKHVYLCEGPKCHRKVLIDAIKSNSYKKNEKNIPPEYKLTK